MKKLHLLFFIVGSLFLLVACEKKEEENKMPALTREFISAKWNTTTSETYESFEFNESGNYIVVKNVTVKASAGQVVLFGTYTITGDYTLVLSEFGSIEVSENEDGSMNFSLKTDDTPAEEVRLDVSMEEEMFTSSRSDLFCRTWKMVKVNDEEVKPGDEYDLSVLFSRAGTYFIEYVDPEDEDDGGLAYWKWVDETETSFYYSWDSPPEWESSDIVQVTDLTETTLKLLEEFDEGESESYELAPVVNKKSSGSTSFQINESQNFSGKGFLAR